MVSQKYRWDFIGLSTDTKPTSETSEKVVNGSTYYCSDTSKLYVYCDGTWYERKPLGGGGGGGTSDFNELTNRPKYNGADMTGSTNIPEVVTYSDFTGTDGTAAGATGLVPAPATTDAGKFLKADGTWGTVQAGPTVVQTTGTSTTDVISQAGVTNLLFNDANRTRVQIGNAGTSGGYNNSVVIGPSAVGSALGATAIGAGTQAGRAGSIALGFGSRTTAVGEMNIGSANTSYGYNNSNYRLLTGLYDGQNDHDAATYGQVISYSAINGAGAPTAATEGKYVGQLYYDTTNEAMYFLKTIDTTTTPATYTWGALGGGSSVNVVQTTGTSTTDVMSQNATTSMVFADPSTKGQVRIGTKNAMGTRATAIGLSSRASGASSIALGTGAKALVQGQFDVSLGDYGNDGYNGSNYRLLTGLYDPQSAHDAATKGYVDGLATMGTLSTSPTGTTVGVPGRLYTYDSGGGTYEVYLCVHDNGDDTYVWKQVSLI